MTTITQTAHEATVTAAHSAAGSVTQHTDSTLVGNWMAVYMSMIRNILANYDLQGSEDQILSQLSEELVNLGQQMQDQLNKDQENVKKQIGENNDYTPVAEEQYNNDQLAYQQKMQTPQRQVDSYTQLAKDNSSSTDTTLQMIQTVQTIPQNSNSMR